MAAIKPRRPRRVVAGLLVGGAVFWGAQFLFSGHDRHAAWRALFSTVLWLGFMIVFLILGSRLAGAEDGALLTYLARRRQERRTRRRQRDERPVDQA